jgi:hypothetical protein
MALACYSHVPFLSCSAPQGKCYAAVAHARALHSRTTMPCCCLPEVGCEVRGAEQSKQAAQAARHHSMLKPLHVAVPSPTCALRFYIRGCFHVQAHARHGVRISHDAETTNGKPMPGRNREGEGEPMLGLTTQLRSSFATGWLGHEKKLE